MGSQLEGEEVSEVQGAGGEQKDSGDQELKIDLMELCSCTG